MKHHCNFSFFKRKFNFFSHQILEVQYYYLTYVYNAFLQGQNLKKPEKEKKWTCLIDVGSVAPSLDIAHFFIFLQHCNVNISYNKLEQSLSRTAQSYSSYQIIKIEFHLIFNQHLLIIDFKSTILVYVVFKKKIIPFFRRMQ